ncbi:O-antigen ligase family protein [Vibrio vulnificus]|uniref:O-antigen ligase family protein n=1 Tax=Vibrio vulnificus TaxID=672 RepID=UPI003241D69F
MKAHKLEGVLLFIILLLPLMPYMSSMTQVVVLFFELILLMSIFSLLIKNKFEFKFSKNEFFILCYIGSLSFVFIMSNFYNSVFTQAVLKPIEALEIIRFVFMASALIFFLIAVDNLSIDEVDYYLSRAVIVVSLFCFLFGFLSWLGLEPFLDISQRYASSDVYTTGYAQFRSFAIVGQPGKQGIFSAILIFISIHQIFFSKYKYLYLLSIILVFPSLVVTFSRISIIFLILYVIFLNVLMKKRSLTIFTGIVVFIMLCVTYYYFSERIMENFARGIDLSEGKISTLGHRMVLKLWALDFVSSDWFRFMFGTGTPKEWIGEFQNPYAFDLSLRNPDSSQTVWFIRYGIVGMTMNYIFYFIVLIKSWRNIPLKNNLGFVFPILFILIVWSFLDPPFHEYKIMVYVMFFSALSFRIGPKIYE